MAVEKGGLRRMPWYAIERIEWRDEAVRVSGKDDAGVAMNFAASLHGHPQAGAWIVKEARERACRPSCRSRKTRRCRRRAPTRGSRSRSSAPQVVGRHCAASGKVISYEPDARVCPRCERVYHKAHVPEACECGASLEELRAATKTA